MTDLTPPWELPEPERSLLLEKLRIIDDREMLYRINQDYLELKYKFKELLKLLDIKDISTTQQKRSK